MKVCESFNGWLETESINENQIASAKIFMQKRYANKLDKNSSELSKEEQDKALSDPDYLKIIKLANQWPGYMLSFVKFHFEQGIPILNPGPREENSIMDLNDLIEVIKNKKHVIQQLPKTIDQYANAGKVGNANGFEQLTDAIGKIERFKEAKWFIDALPKPLRDQYRSLNSEKQNGLITSAILLSKSGKNSIDRLFKKIKAMTNWPIEDFIEYTANYIKGLENSNMSSKIKELEDLSPEAGILYSDGQYLVMSMRTEEAQKKLCSIANWCINRGSFHRYADKGIQINIFNFETDVTDPLFLTGTTIAFDKTVTDSHDINDDNIKRTSNPVIHFQNLGYPKDLIDSIMNNFNTECDIKTAISELWEKTKGLNTQKIISSLFQATRGFLSGSMSEDEWGKIAGVVAEIISDDRGINKKDFMNHFKENGIISDTGLNVFNSLIGDDYTKSDIEDILKATERVIVDIKHLLDDYEKEKAQHLDEPKYKDLLVNLRKVIKEEQNIIKKIKAKL
jgi:hypothetical protein